jgi:hypothetical protein
MFISQTYELIFKQGITVLFKKLRIAGSLTKLGCGKLVGFGNVPAIG